MAMAAGPLVIGVNEVEVASVSAQASTLNWRRSIMYCILFLETDRRKLLVSGMVTLSIIKIERCC